MRILITGFIVFLIWSFFSMWLYVDILRPAAKKPVVLQPAPESQNKEADSLMKVYASMPKDLLIYFEFDKTKFNTDPQTDSSIVKFKAWLDKHPEAVLSITGHTDFIGTTAYNQALGLERAQIIRKYLENKGIPPERMVATSRGEEQPIASHITSEGRAKNRRTEITIKK
jgi:outer membrane protein OmpA-like peptidoglycan-associated protein